MLLRAAILVLLSPLAGCMPMQPPLLTPSARDALESRRFDAPRDAVVRAAATALLDDGYLIRSSDFEAGLVCGERVSLYYAGRSGYARAGGFGAPAAMVDIAVVWIRAEGAGSAGRLHLEFAGFPAQEPPPFAEFWRRVDARLLPREASR